MNDTKKRILKTALSLFNSQGLAKVTLRTIANNMGISQGNLNYHFKKREDIIEELYFQLVRNIDSNMLATRRTENILEQLFSISKFIMYNFYEYRFFLLDFVQIMRENKKIKLHYIELTYKREKQFEFIFYSLVKNGLIRKEILPNEYNCFYKRSKILVDFWISSATTEEQSLTKKSISIYSELINQAIFPYLTIKGREVYKSLVEQ